MKEEVRGVPGTRTCQPPDVHEQSRAAASPGCAARPRQELGVQQQDSTVKLMNYKSWFKSLVQSKQETLVKLDGLRSLLKKVENLSVEVVEIIEAQESDVAEVELQQVLQQTEHLRKTIVNKLQGRSKKSSKMKKPRYSYRPAALASRGAMTDMPPCPLPVEKSRHQDVQTSTTSQEMVNLCSHCNMKANGHRVRGVQLQHQQQVGLRLD